MYRNAILVGIVDGIHDPAGLREKSPQLTIYIKTFLKIEKTSNTCKNTCFCKKIKCFGNGCTLPAGEDRFSISGKSEGQTLLVGDLFLKTNKTYKKRQKRIKFT